MRFRCKKNCWTRDPKVYVALPNKSSTNNFLWGYRTQYSYVEAQGAGTLTRRSAGSITFSQQISSL